MSKEVEDREYIYITDDDGKDVKFEIIYEFEAEDRKYLLVVPTDISEDEEEAEVYAFRYEEQGDDLILYTIEDEKEWDMIEEVFNTLDYEFNQ
ncbi:hypothetical protein BHF71_03015 [Vulcanibacillus modesticaldus]|uniref:UPF0473 protein BHF71_03015 n=1 Tax=Vulcanibacillus modesticaldus TaxID=337097 RepID=A0A1D2YT91_9BACI|nr:DUF1292 domain-containing protein [Vulcanibacillus modesticaldus]OEF98912.1 hypothetical protein BHF71_03015 [Vulcanibacillus modesticaldus]